MTFTYNPPHAATRHLLSGKPLLRPKNRPTVSRGRATSETTRPESRSMSLKIIDEIKKLSAAEADETAKAEAAAAADDAYSQAKDATVAVKAEFKAAVKKAASFILTHDDAGRPVAIVPDGSDAGYHFEPMLTDDQDLDALNPPPGPDVPPVIDTPPPETPPADVPPADVPPPA